MRGKEKNCCRHSTLATFDTNKHKKLLSSRQTMKRHSNSTGWLLLMAVCFLFLGGHSWLFQVVAGFSSSSPTQMTSSDSRSLVKQHHDRHHRHHHHQHQHQHQQDNIHRRRHHIDSSNSNQQHPFSSSKINETFALQDYLLKRSHHFEPSESQQLPIVVSSSDNSYVSASPIIIITGDQTTPRPTSSITTTTTTTTTTSDKATLVVDNEPAVNNYNHQHWPYLSTGKLEQQHHFPSPSHSRRLLISNNIRNHHDNDDDDLSSASEEKTHHNKLRFWHKNPPLWSSSRASLDSTISSNQLLDNRISSGSSSTSDISTTATTTQRNSHDSTVPSELVKPPTATTKPESLLSRFEIKLATIIDTQESINGGATFINYTVVTNFDACLVECWITDSCDTAVYQESTIASSSSSSSSSSHSREHINNIRHLHSEKRQASNDIAAGLHSIDGGGIYHICFLFECVKSDQIRCQFSSHDNYVSAILTEKITAPREEEKQLYYDNGEQYDVGFSDKIHSNDTPVVSMNDDQEQDYASRNCVHGDLKFKCLLPDAVIACIENDQRCDGVVDCSDGSDESNCPDDSNISSGHKLFRSVSSNQVVANSVEVNDDAASDDEISSETHAHQYNLIDQQDQPSGKSYNLEPALEPSSEVHYSKIINTHQHGHPLNGRWHDTHIASIRIGEYVDYGKGGLNSALIAILFGVAITAMLIMIVGHKMRSIRKRLAYKNRRRTLVPDKELFINTTMPI